MQIAKNWTAGREMDDSVGVSEGGAEARAAILARRVAALEAVVAIERRLRQVQEASNRAVSEQLAARDAQPDITVPRPVSNVPYDDDATIPVPQARAMAASGVASPAPIKSAL